MRALRSRLAIVTLGAAVACGEPAAPPVRPPAAGTATLQLHGTASGPFAADGAVGAAATARPFAQPWAAAAPTAHGLLRIIANGRVSGQPAVLDVAVINTGAVGTYDLDRLNGNGVLLLGYDTTVPGARAAQAYDELCLAASGEIRITEHSAERVRGTLAIGGLCVQLATQALRHFTIEEGVFDVPVIGGEGLPAP